MGSKEVHRMHARVEKEFQRMREKKVDSWQARAVVTRKASLCPPSDSSGASRFGIRRSGIPKFPD